VLIRRSHLKFFDQAFSLRRNTLFGIAQFSSDTFVCPAFGEPPRLFIRDACPSELGLIYLNGHRAASLFCSDVIRRKIQMPGVRRVVRGNVGAIPGNRSRRIQLSGLRLACA
jgi:hypothetical protein